MRVAIQGIAGSFHEQAANEYFAEQSFDIVECQTFRAVFDAVQKDQAEFGVVAVENSLHGSINQVYRLLDQEKLWVCGETRLHIAMCLVGCQPASLTELNRADTVVTSHFAAFGQCEQWLNTNLPLAVLRETEDTAKAVKDIVASNDPHVLAIASEHAAKLYNGVVLERNLNDATENYTRFFVITKQPQENPDANRTSIILQENAQDKAGTLYQALGLFAEAGISLSKLDSHPRPGATRSYAFYIDFDESSTSEAGKKVLEQLEKDGWKLQVLGSYVAKE